MKRKKTIYTSLDCFSIKGWNVESYTKLNISDWIEHTTKKLLSDRNKAELDAGNELQKAFSNVEKQVFFMIHGRCYFLDYYLPQKRVAIEIDGNYHNKRKSIDKQRDSDFLEIGIRTIRISDKDVLSGKLTQKLSILTPKTTIKKNKRKTSIKDKSIAKSLSQATKRLKQHDKMKNKARWI